jgi:hypothetical protein
MSDSPVVLATTFSIPSFLTSTLSELGGIHRVVFGYHRLLAKRFPFAVYYRISKDEVLITAVLDCCRNPSWIRERLMRS